MKYLLLFIYLFLSGNFKKYLSSSNYTILIIRGTIFLPIPFILFVSFNEISVWDGKTFEYCGSSSTSSKVRDSFIDTISLFRYSH